MTVSMYQDRSSTSSDLEAGFQFQFDCALCGKRWLSDYKPYRTGRMTGRLSRFLFLFGNAGYDASQFANGLSDSRARGAHDAALAEAMQEAERRYVDCPQCRQTVCNDCFDSARNSCSACLDKKSTGAAAADGRATGAAQCPNCQTATSGRFCPECGFDMASTHKTCPGCGATVTRESRFCGDCGHGF